MGENRRYQTGPCKLRTVRRNVYGPAVTFPERGPRPAPTDRPGDTGSTRRAAGTQREPPSHNGRLFLSGLHAMMRRDSGPWWNDIDLLCGPVLYVHRLCIPVSCFMLVTNHNNRLIRADLEVGYDDFDERSFSISVTYGAHRSEVLIDANSPPIKQLIAERDRRLFHLIEAVFPRAFEMIEEARERDERELEKQEESRNTPTESSNPDEEEGYVYLIEAGGYYKIGLSRNPESRADQIDSVLPFEGELLHTIQTGNMLSAENELHERYAHRKVRNEWFDLEQREVEEILDINRI